jgi:hypothetical protein
MERAEPRIDTNEHELLLDGITGIFRILYNGLKGWHNLAQGNALGNENQ